jgi:hypothetical protein
MNNLTVTPTGIHFQPAGFLQKPALNVLASPPFLTSTDSFVLQPNRAVTVRNGATSPNFKKNEPSDSYLDAYNERIDNLTAERTGLTEAGYTTDPNSGNSFWYGVDKSANTIRSKLMGSLRSQDWLNNMLPTIQSIRKKSTEKGDNFTFTKGIETVPTLQGEMVEVETPRFCFPKARSSDGIFRLSLLGDPGYNTATLHYNLAAIKALPETLARNEGEDYQWDALLSMGDNLYGEDDESQSKKAPKNQSGHPDHFWNNIGNAYSDFFADDIPFFTALGNHEVKNGHKDKFLKYVDLPPFYRMSFGGDDKGDGACVEIFVINMTGFRPSESVKLQSSQANSVAEAEAETKLQNAWLLNQLADSMKSNPKAKRLIVGHYPIFQQDQTVEMSFAKEFRYTIGLIYQNLLDQKITTVNGEKPTPIDMWLNGHVHKFTVNQSSQLATDEGQVFELPSTLTQWAAGCTAHCEQLGKEEQWTNDRDSSTSMWAEATLGLDSMDVLCQNIGTGFSAMEINPEETEKPITISFIQPPMQPLKTTGKKQEGTYWWGQLVETGALSSKEAHPENYKAVYTMKL